MSDGVVVLDAELRVIAWNHRAADLWGLRAEEVRGKNFLNLDIGLPVLQLTQPMRSCMSDGERQLAVLDATNRRGKPVAVRIVCSRLADGLDGAGPGVILNMREVADEAEGAAAR